MKRSQFRFNPHRLQIIGNFYTSGKRREVAIASFEEARVASVVQTGRLWKPIYKTERDRKWSVNFLTRRWEEKHQDLLTTSPSSAPLGPLISKSIQEWLDVSEHTRSPGTRDLYLLVSNNYLESVGDHPIGSISLRHIDKFTVWMNRRNLASQTMRQRLTILKTFLLWAVDREYLAKAPKITMPITDRKLPAIHTPEHLQALYERIANLKAGAKSPPRRRAYLLHERFLMVATGTGARRSEIFHLPWSAIDLEQGMIRIRKAGNFQVKERRDKNLPLPKFLFAYLNREREENPAEVWLLDDGAGQMFYRNPHALTVAFRRHQTALGFGELGIKAVHGFRAQFADYLVNKLGLDLATAQQWLGHSDIKVTAGYIADPEHRVQSAAKLVKPLFTLGPKKGLPRLAKA